MGEVKLSNGAVLSAESVPAGAFTPPNATNAAAAGFTSLPAFCRVTSKLTPSADSDIRIEVWLPLSGWNHKIQAAGNGGGDAGGGGGGNAPRARRRSSQNAPTAAATSTTDTSGRYASHAIAIVSSVSDSATSAATSATPFCTSEPRIGTTSAIGLMVAGNLAMGAVIDRYGLFGLDRIAFRWERVLGIVLLAIGAALSLKR